MDTNRTETFPALIALIVTTVAAAHNGGAVDPLTATVTRVERGDSIVVQSEGRVLHVALDGIDCPEPEQPFGDRAMEFTSNFLAGQRVHVEPLAPPDGSTMRARVTRTGIGDAGLLLVKAGLAWVAPDVEDEVLREAQRSARERGRGLWSDADPLPPWRFRESRPDAPVDSGETPMLVMKGDLRRGPPRQAPPRPPQRPPVARDVVQRTQPADRHPPSTLAPELHPGGRTWRPIPETARQGFVRLPGNRWLVLEEDGVRMPARPMPESRARQYPAPRHMLAPRPVGTVTTFH